MSVIFYPQLDGHDLLVIGVDAPGHGYLWVRDWREGEDCRRVINLAGPQLGEILTSLTELTITTSGDSHYVGYEVAHLGRFDRAQIRAILPSFQRAVIYASTRSEFAERILDQPERDERPRDLVCVDCGEGHVYSSDAGRTSTWCAECGHRPFGIDTTWTRAQERYGRDVEWFEVMHRRAEPSPVVGS